MSFIPGERRRGVTPGNIGDIAPVPLFVKRPGQKSGAVVDRHVRTTDIVPTIADVVGTPLPYAADGRSLFDAANDRDEVVVMERTGERVAAPAGAVAQARNETVARQTRTFGARSWESLFAVGPNAELVGRSIAAMPTATADDVAATVDNATLLADVDRASALSPAHVTGRLEGDEVEPGTDLAISVDGEIAAVTRSFQVGGDVKLSAFIPERAFRPGANEVDVHVVLPSGALARVGGTGESARFALAPDGRSIETPQGRTVPVRPEALAGVVEDWFLERDTVRFGGWAGDLRARRPATNVLVFADGKLVYSGTPSVGRAELGTRHPGLGRSGFVVELRRELVGDGGTVELRFFALRGDAASELTYAEGFPWAPSP